MPEPGRADGLLNLAVAVAIAACVAALLPQDDRPASSPVVFVPAAEVSPPSPADLAAPAATQGSRSATLVVAGDVMQHASQAADSFDASYAPISPLLRRADLAIANLEFPVLASRPADPDPDSVQFNGSPAHLDALASAGFSMLSMANNHAYDQGIEGIRATIDELEHRGIGVVGAARTRSELENRIVMRDLHGIRIAFFAYTGLLNTYLRNEFEFDDPPADLPLFFANFAEWDGDYAAAGTRMMREHVERARAAGADLVVALVHWGEEWKFAPTADQVAAAHALVDSGFDLVVGGHGHVLNSPEVYRGRLVVYSLGNLLCDFSEWQARTGALLEVHVTKNPSGEAGVADYTMHPLLVRRQGHVIEPLSPASAKGSEEESLAWSLASRMLGHAVPHAAAAD